MGSFEDIRPYEDLEVAGVIGRLLRDQEFLQFIGKWQAPRLHRFLPWLVEMRVIRQLGRQLSGVDSIRSFQEIIARAAKRLVEESITEFRYEGLDKLNRQESYLFISNHRDIAGDSLLLNYALYLSGFDTVRIAVGDNLIQRRFATDLMKLNKSFFIKRSIEGTRNLYKALMQSSEYIRTSLREGSSVWIAQSEGRAKNGIDQTDPAVIKMLTLYERKRDFAESIAAMKIVPMSLSYEFDPCDEMKARELTSVALSGEYEKTEGEDLLSLVKGLAGHKGNVILRLGEVLDASFATAEEVADEVDRQVMDNFELFPINYWALSQIQEGHYQKVWNQVQDKAAVGDRQYYEARLENCEARHREQWLKMYANPVVNKFRSG
ncbi:MAG: 1-acyl-sn-glycerol-3-phosphate acyltransferase [Gammaproteobacteria bacterium]|nr:1-acyl-sn-glycerol-3-phosphate acyltransferase [Gammaproteobacteria bacterium]